MWQAAFPLLITYFQVIFGEVLFLLKAERRDLFVLRVAGSLVVCIGLLLLYATLMTFSQNDIISIFAYILVLCLGMLSAFCCFRIPLIGAVCVATSSYALQHIAYTVNMIAEYLCGRFDEFFRYAGFILPFAVMLLVYLIFIRRNEPLYDSVDAKQIFIALLLLLVCIILNSLRRNGGAETLYVAIYDLICCLSCFFIQFSLSRGEKVKQDNKLLVTIMQKEHEQHELSKQAVSMLNIKFHDLKNQISHLQEIVEKGEAAQELEQVRRAVRIYGSMANTGNATLDAILMEKGLICEMNKIRFSYIADGAQLSFMQAVDVFSLFNNMLDNAIESVLQEEDREKRLVSMRVERSNDTLLIEVENYCAAKLKFYGGLPATTKKDKSAHGFGLRGIKFVVDKYGGTMRFSQEEEMVRVCIVFACA